MPFDLSNHDAVEAAAVAVLILGGLIAIAASLLLRTHSGTSSGPGPVGETVRHASMRRSVFVMVAAASVGAGIIHLGLGPEHVAEIGALGLGFFVVGVAQLIWAGMLVHLPSRASIWLGIAGNAAVILAWAWTRTVGLPVGPDAWMPEAIGWADSVSFLFELGIIVVLVVHLSGLRMRNPRLSAVMATMTSIGAVPVIGMIVVLTTLALSSHATATDHMTMSMVGGAALLTSRRHRPEADPLDETCLTCGHPLRRTKKGWRHEPRHGN